MIANRIFCSLFCVLLCSASYNAQDRIEDSSFYNYLKEVSEKYQLQFAVDPTAIKNISTDGLAPEASYALQLEKLNSILLSNNMSYIIIENNKILIREGIAIENVSVPHIVSGEIRASYTQEPLAYASVRIQHANLGVPTDANGEFSIPIPQKYSGDSLIIQYLGYKTKRISIEDCIGKVNVKLDLSNETINEVFVISHLPDKRTALSDQKITIDLSNLYIQDAASFFNAYSGSIISSIASVSQSSKNRGIYIRGLASNAIMVMNNIPVYRYQNYYSFLDNFNDLYFDQMSIYKNASPIEWSHFAFGMIKLDAKPYHELTHLNVESNLYYTNAELSIPLLDDKWMIKLAGRKSYTNFSDYPSFARENRETNGLIRNSRDQFWYIAQQPSYSFYDINNSIHYKDDKQYLNLSYYKSDNEKRSASRSMKSFNEDKIHINEEIYQKEMNINQGYSFLYSRVLTPTLSAKFLGYQSDSSMDMFTNINILRTRNQHTKEKINLRNRVMNTYRDREFNASIVKNHKSNSYTLGTLCSSLKSNINISDKDVSFEQNSTNNYFSLYGEAQHKWNNALTSTIALSMFNNSKLSNQYWNTSFQLNYKINDHLNIVSLFSHQYQFFNEINLENIFGQNIRLLSVSGINPSSVNKYMVGYQYVGGNWKINNEFYYYKTSGLINLSQNKVGFLRKNDVPKYLFDTGKGKSYGIDLSFTYSKNRYNTSLEYTWNKSTVRYDHLYNANEVPLSTDRRQQLNWIQSYSYHQWQFSITNIFMTGTPYIDFQRIEEDQDRNEIRDINSIIARLPNYYSLDLAVAYYFGFFKQKASLNLSLLNATNHNNTTSILQSTRISSIDNRINILSASTYKRLFNITFRIHLF